MGKDKSFLEYNPPTNGWRITPLSLEKEKEHLTHVRQVASKLKEKRGDFKLPVSTKQTPYVERLMSMNEDELTQHRKRKLPTKKEAQASQEQNEKALENFKLYQTYDEYGNHTPQGPYAMSEAGIHSSNVKNTIGQTELGTTEEKKESAIEAFLKTEATLLPIHKAMINTADPKALQHKEAKPEKPRPLWRRLLGAKWIWTHEDGPEWKSRK